jgi:indole-3-glycerol phosphate synthase
MRSLAFLTARSAPMPLPEGSLIKPFIRQRLEDLNRAKAKRSLGQIQGQVGEMPTTRGFQGRLAAQFKATGEPGVIAELKGASPFEAGFRRAVNYKDLGEDFEAVGAACLSVAVHRRVYGGSYADLAAVHDAVQIPVLARDIVVDVYQLLEARLAGADAVVLIAGLLGDSLSGFLDRATSIALDSLVEVHTRAELDLALGSGATLICVTSRDIHSFAREPEAWEALLPLIPPDKALAIAEGGLDARSDLDRMGRLGAKGVLMGMAMMTDADPAGVLEQVLGVETAD